MERNVTQFSMLHGDNKGDDLFFKKMISRNSSVGYSSRTNLYFRSHEGIPFEWEMEPGTPKEPPRVAPLPPLSPPPAVISLSLPKPCFEDQQQAKRNDFTARFMRLNAWKKIINKYRLKKTKRVSKKGHVIKDHQQMADDIDVGRASDVEDKLEDCVQFWSTDPRDDFTGSRSSNSSSSSFSNGLTNDGNPGPLHGRSRIISCMPLKFNAILVHLAKRS